MPDQADNAASINYDDLLEIAKKAVASACEIESSEVNVDEDGEIGFGVNGSVLLFIKPFAEPDEPSGFMLRAQLLDVVEDKPLVYTTINDVNQDLGVGTIFYNKETIWFIHRLFVNAPTAQWLEEIITIITNVIEDYDDKLKSRLGGERFLEKADDEIVV